MITAQRFHQNGYLVFPADPALHDWVTVANAAADAILRDPALQQQWLQCQGTWFVGVDVLPNDLHGALPGGPPLCGMAVDFIRRHLLWPAPQWHAGQLSVIWPGYPQRRAEESDAAFRYRIRRDGAHVDGLLPEGVPRRRFLREPHQFVLGLPLEHTDAGASALVVWRGSHHIVRRYLHEGLARVAPAQWSEVDLTDVYQAARRACFEQCERVLLPAGPRQATLLHRLCLHGISPWQAGAEPASGRRIVYFRPQFASMGPWLHAP